MGFVLVDKYKIQEKELRES